MSLKSVTRLLDAIRIVDPGFAFIRLVLVKCLAKWSKCRSVNRHLLPTSPYGVAKVYGHWITINYRESYGFAYHIRHIV